MDGGESGDDQSWIWPSQADDLMRPASSYLSFADIGWQRTNGSYGRISGFRRAAEILYEAMIASAAISDLDTIVFPYAACWRHHIELQLKVVSTILRTLLERTAVASNTHDLAKLWQQVKDMLHQQWPDDTADLVHVTRVIGQLSAIDPNGQGFRYDRDVKGNLTLGNLDQVNLPTFHNALRGVSNFLSAVDAHADYDLDLKRDIATYYADEFRQYE